MDNTREEGLGDRVGMDTAQVTREETINKDFNWDKFFNYCNSLVEIRSIKNERNNK